MVNLFLHFYLVVSKECLYAVVWFQVFLSNTNNYVVLSNYFYLNTNNFRTEPFDSGTATITTHLGPSWPGSNGNEDLFYIPQISKMEPSPSGAV